MSTTYSTATLPFSPSSMYVASNSNSLRRSWLPSSSRWVHEEKGRVYGAEITLCTWFYYHLNDFFLTTEMFVLDKRDEGCKGVASKSVWHIWGWGSVPCFRGCQKNSVQNFRGALQYSKCLGGDPPPPHPFSYPVDAIVGFGICFAGQKMSFGSQKLCWANVRFYHH